jgi:hypothetical protein
MYARHQLDRGTPVDGLANHFQVRRSTEEHGEAAPDQRFVVGDRNPYHATGS